MNCKHFGMCGGCLYQDISYEEELYIKESQIRELFFEFKAKIRPILPSPKIFGYRNKMEFSFSEVGGMKQCGLSKRGGKGVIEHEECLLVRPWFIKVLNAVHKLWKGSELRSYYPAKDKGHLRCLSLREGIRTGQKMVTLTISGNSSYPFHESNEIEFRDAILECEKIDSLILRKQILKKGEPTRFDEKPLFGKESIEEVLYAKEKGYTFSLRSASFFQPNPEFAEIFFSLAREYLSNQEPLLLDLYCGSAVFGILAERSAEKILGIEISSDSILDAKKIFQQIAFQI